MSTNFFPEDGTIQVSFSDEKGFAMEVKCLAANIPSGVPGYAVGCELIAEDTGAHYYNTGDETSCTFALNTTIAPGSVGTAQLAAGAVTKAKLAAGVQASHMIVFAGQPTTVGGAAAEAITVTGALNTDLAFVQIVDNGAANVSVVSAVMTADTLTVTFSADPTNDVVINYQIVRATS